VTPAPAAQPSIDRAGLLQVLAARTVWNQRRARRPESPAELAHLLDPEFNITPTIRMLSDIAVRSVLLPNQRDIVTCSPRTGKSKLLSVWLPVWALMRDPDMQIMVISHSDDLAKRHSEEVQDIIRRHSDYLGFKLSQDKSAAGRWRVDGKRGGMLAAGIMSGPTGHGAELLIIDDVFKDAQQADSAAHRKRILNEYRMSLSTRVHAGGSRFLVMTRWHEQDLAGILLDTEPDMWNHTNVPAVAESGVPDALGRPFGQVMLSANGFTPDEFAKRRREVGERAWYAMFQGVPVNPEGALIKKAWLQDHRLTVAPAAPDVTVVAVDPSDSGEGDACGLVAMSRFGRRVALVADRSAPMTSDAWARAAVALAREVGASEIAIESFAARETYRRVAQEALDAAGVDSVRVSAWPPKGTDRGKGDALARSAALLQGFETGRMALLGHHPGFEAAALSWQAGQHQPDCLAAAVVGFDVLVSSIGQVWDWSPPGPAQVSERGMFTGGRGRGDPFGASRGSSLPGWMTKPLPR